MEAIVLAIVYEKLNFTFHSLFSVKRQMSCRIEVGTNGTKLKVLYYEVTSVTEVEYVWQFLQWVSVAMAQKFYAALIFCISSKEDKIIRF